MLQSIGASATAFTLAGCLGDDDDDDDAVGDDTDDTDPTDDNGNGEPDPVVMASPQTTAELPMYIAEERGIWEEKNIAWESHAETSASDSVPALAAGDYDMAFGSLGAGVINSILQDLDVSIVVDAARSPPETPDGLQYHVRSEIYEEGATLGEMGEGMTWGMNGSNNVAEFLLGRTLESHGLTFDDIEIEMVPFPQQVSALDGGSIDVAQMVGELGALARAEGIAEFVEYVGRANPEHSVSVGMAGGHFMEERPDVLVRFIEGYMEGYRIMLEEGYYTEEIMDIAERNLELPPPVFNSGIPVCIHQNGAIYTESVLSQVDYYECAGEVEEIPDQDRLIDESFREEAIDNIGEVDDPIYGLEFYEQLDGGPDLPLPEESHPPEDIACGGVNFLG